MATYTTAPANRYALTRQKPLTENAQEQERQNLQGLQTGQFADVQSAANATQRANAMRTTQGLQAARGTVGRDGTFSGEAAIRAQDQALASANAQNLNATNSVNQLQRQYRQDALNTAGQIEDRNQNSAIGERNYQTNLDAQDLAQKNTDRAFGANREDAATANSQWEKSFGANRADTAFNQNFQTSQAADDRNRFDITRQDNRADTAFNQNFQTGQAAEDTRRYDLTRGDQNAQFATTTGLNQQQINNQASQFDKSLNQADKQFQQNYGLETQRISQAQQQIENQAAQAAAQLGYNYASLSQADKQYMQDLVQRQTEFGVNSGQQQQQINNQMNQYALSRADQNYQFNASNELAKQQLTNQTTQQQYQQTMDKINSIQDPKARQSAYNAYMAGQDVSQFITQNLYDSNGNLNAQYQSASPGQQNAQAVKDELKAYYPDKSDAEITAMAQQRLQQADFAAQAPITAAMTEAEKASLQAKLNTGTQLQPDEFKKAQETGVVQNYTPASLLLDSGLASSAKIGDTISLNGQQYKIYSAPKDYNGKSYVVVTNPSGEMMYVQNGQLTPNKPSDKAPTATAGSTSTRLVR